MPAIFLPPFADTRIADVPLLNSPSPVELECVKAELALGTALEMYNFSRVFVIVTRSETGELSTTDDTYFISAMHPPVRDFGKGEEVDVPTLRYLIHVLVSRLSPCYSFKVFF